MGLFFLEKPFSSHLAQIRNNAGQGTGWNTDHNLSGVNVHVTPGPHITKSIGDLTRHIRGCRHGTTYWSSVSPQSMFSGIIGIGVEYFHSLLGIAGQENHIGVELCLTEGREKNRTKNSRIYIFLIFP